MADRIAYVPPSLYYARNISGKHVGTAQHINATAATAATANNGPPFHDSNFIKLIKFPRLVYLIISLRLPKECRTNWANRTTALEYGYLSLFPAKSWSQFVL